jgi:hypothetical protein
VHSRLITFGILLVGHFENFILTGIFMQENPCFQHS